MAWNEPGKPGQDPWGSSSNNNGSKKPEEPQQPNNSNNNDPDLDEMLRKAQQLFGGAKNKMGGSESFGAKGISVVVLIIVFIWVLSGIYIVEPAERGVETRFGAFIEETTAGPHWHIPFPFESVTKVNVDRVRTAEVGYRVDDRGQIITVGSEALMLSKDENIISVKIAVQYKIQSASDFLFEVSDPEVSLRAITESALREVVGQNNMEFILTQGRDDVVAKVKEIAQFTLDKYRTGIYITSVNLQDAQPPEQVQAAFADAVKAREDKIRIINEAQAYANSVLPVARGQSARMLEEASAHHDRVIAEATGKSSRFISVLYEYERSSEVTRKRLYMDAKTNVLSRTSTIFVGAESGTNLLYLPLDKMMAGQQQATVPFQASQGASPMTNTQTNTAQQAARSPSPQSNIRDFLSTREIR